MAVSVSDRKGVMKHNVPAALLHGGSRPHGRRPRRKRHRQVSLLALESIDKMVALGAKVSPGDFAENLTVQGVSVMHLPVGTRLKVGPEAELDSHPDRQGLPQGLRH